MTDTRLTPLAASLPSTIPFVAPERIEAERGTAFAARLGANELSFGPSPKAISAMTDALSGIWKYGVPENEPLRTELATHLNIAPEAVTIGEGIDGLLGILVRLYVGAGDAVVTSDGSYPTFNYHVAGAGGMLHKVPYKDDFENPKALIAKASEVGAKLVYLSNPNNPMGSVHNAQTVQSMIDAVPDGCLLVLDEAYAEFAPDGTTPQIDISDKRVIRFRTFSKAYGLAGARIGYGISHPEIISGFDKIRNHFGVNRVAQAGALAALHDHNYLSETLEKVDQARVRLAQIAQDNGLIPLLSAANFVTIDCGRDGDFARSVLAALSARGVFVRMPGAAPLDRCIRISVGLPQELDILAERLPLALQDARDHIDKT
ncbi:MULTISPECIES: pyridoxal phosphate-dependent aminotransferase [Pacificibacter]|uniref:pyridoxal phosphate-dependent aminotransferase n=1 Tax=Pacificibacter TaxID=1042323 RepID=UPI001C09CEE4|nr:MULTISPECIES: pyridoxal phosphate-dependent aminotransferase [Pacificibacter]MBU2934477.1 pyridoxal phosphate-dependent aminotransferase [Pacificibacter marinus]MDO6617201.1 pyridoxal phosphate-dependent aminotransferase [Pacificibacter sp. 1_MG-2023]